MPQTAIAINALKQNNVNINAGDLAVTETAGDTVNGLSFSSTGKEVLLVRNTDAVAHTFTITSIADHLGRTGDVANYSVPANSVVAIQMSTLEGWRSVITGLVTLIASSNLLNFSVLRLS